MMLDATGSKMYIRKYKTVKICPIPSRGGSTGLAPIQVSKNTIVTRDQNMNLLIGYAAEDRIFRFIEKERVRRIKIDMIRAITPPNLLGIDRRIAYANKKYHSGLIWIGVTKGFAKMKFSESPKSYGIINEMNMYSDRRTKNPIESLTEKNGWNEILSKFLDIPAGLLEPVWCKNRRCKTTMAAMTKGKMKWKEKNRVRVALSTANPPHNHWTIIVPI